MTRTKQTYLLAFMMVGSTVLFSQNLIKNGDCEAPPPTFLGITDWTMEAGITWKRGTELPRQSGDYYFFPQRVANAELAQNVDVSAYTCTIDAGGQGFEFRGYMRTLLQTQNDACRIVLEYKNAAGTTLSTFDTGNQYPTDNWTLVRDWRVAPRGTRRVRIRLISTRNWGDDNDGVYDNLSLVAAPAVMKFDSVSITRATCGDRNTNGSVKISVSGGIQPLRFTMVNGATQNDSVFTNLRGGQSYVFRIVDSSGCYNATATADIPTTTLPSVAIVSVDSVKCGLPNGRISLQGTGGTGKLEYSINGMTWQIGKVFTNLLPQNYLIQVRDSLGCVSDMPNLSLDLPQIPAPSLDSLKVTPSVCGDKKGKIEVIARGSAPLTFGFDTNRLSAIRIFDTLSSGNYTVYMRDRVGCTISKSTTIIKTEAPKILDVEAISESCKGSDGALRIIAEGNSMLNFRLDSAAFSRIDTFKNLRSGSFTITVRDSFGCIATRKATVGKDSLPTITEIMLGKTECLKATGTVLIKAKSAAGGLKFSLDSVNYQTNNVFRDLKVGKLRVYVQDAKGCRTAKDTVVSQDCGIFVPNIFSPNGDGTNDHLAIFGDPSVFEKILTYQIYNRWGNLLFDGATTPLNTQNAGWDGMLNGKTLENGVYVYLLKVQLKNGEFVQQTGDVYLMR